jgi:hypothetical protein
LAVAGDGVSGGSRRAASLFAGLHTCAARRSAQNPGPVERKLREELETMAPKTGDLSLLTPAPDGKKQYRCEFVGHCGRQGWCHDVRVKSLTAVHAYALFVQRKGP